mgnify:CR=1 FL=1
MGPDGASSQVRRRENNIALMRDSQYDQADAKREAMLDGKDDARNDRLRVKKKKPETS